MYAKLLIESQKLKIQPANFLNNSMNPKISVIQTIRSSHHSETQIESLMSIVNQTYSNWELVIVNDGGVLADLLSNKILFDNKHKIKIINSEKIGRSNALNIGIKNATGDYICYLDADNYYDDKFFEIMLNSAIEKDLDLIYCAQLRFSDDSVTPLYYNNLTKNNFLKFNKIDLNSILHKAILTKDNKNNKDGFFDSRLTRLIDWAILLKLFGQDLNINSIPFIGSYYFDGFRTNRISSNDEYQDNMKFITSLILNNEDKKLTSNTISQHCQFCDYTGNDFKSSGTKSTVFEQYSVFGGGYRANNVCPQCGSFDRYRSLNYIIKDIALRNDIKQVLHIAPEPKIMTFISETIPDANVILGDKYPNNSKILKIDLTNIPFKSSSFDLILCSHVLEHIKQDRIAINEIFRALKPGGYAICPTPYSEIIFSSIEEPISINYSENQRKTVFGQPDHVKLYELNDYISRFTSIGFKHIKFDINILKKYDANACEMFVFQKPDELSETVDDNNDSIPLDFTKELGGWAIEKDLVNLIDNLSYQFENPSLVEFGSGRGSKSLAHLMKKHNGKMSSVEGDENWANLVDEELTSNDLSDYVQILYAPLAHRIELGVSTKFYSESFLDYIEPDVDLVIVDGPQGDISPVARYPALKSIYPKLNKNKFYIILDDYNRVDEKLIVEMWKLDFPNLNFLPIKLEKKQICIISNISLDDHIKFSIQQ
jgi:glycosyltransferase involved in cell wall biosynthesis